MEEFSGVGKYSARFVRTFSLVSVADHTHSRGHGQSVEQAPAKHRVPVHQAAKSRPEQMPCPAAGTCSCSRLHLDQPPTHRAPSSPPPSTVLVDDTGRRSLARLRADAVVSRSSACELQVFTPGDGVANPKLSSSSTHLLLLLAL